MTLLAPGPAFEYRKVDGRNVAEIPHAQGIALPSETGLIRPFGIFAMGSLATMHALAGGRERIEVPLMELPGIACTGMSRPGETLFSSNPVVSLRYYKAGSNGAPETEARIIALDGFGYGVHPGHAGEKPTWYLYGAHLGNTVVDEAGVVVGTSYLPPDQVQEKHFSMARIVDGPLGDPLTDAAHRARWAIPEIVAPAQ
ncbi:MAG: hypothetical protein ABWY71_02770 [Candidatus Saccharimonadales bacterium]